MAIKYGLGKLPLPPAEYVPDRMLVAQAQCDSLTLLTADQSLRRYDVPIEWVG
jgi:PIN domain nuclease of toxin-antitoxin system